MKNALLVWCGMVMAACGACLPACGDEWFGRWASVADDRPKGPTHCFRQFNVDWSWISLQPKRLPEFRSQADPAAFAEFCRQTKVDGTVVMAVLGALVDRVKNHQLGPDGKPTERRWLAAIDSRRSRSVSMKKLLCKVVAMVTSVVAAQSREP